MDIEILTSFYHRKAIVEPRGCGSDELLSNIYLFDSNWSCHLPAQLLRLQSLSNQAHESVIALSKSVISTRKLNIMRKTQTLQTAELPHQRANRKLKLQVKLQVAKKLWPRPKPQESSAIYHACNLAYDPLTQFPTIGRKMAGRNSFNEVSQRD